MLNEKQKAIIEELQSIVLELHRSAGGLDDMVRQIVETANTIDDEEYVQLFMISCSNYRKQLKSVYGYDKLETKETNVISKLNPS